MESFRECGWASFVALGMGMLALLVGVVALALALIKPRTGQLIGVVALAFSCGPGGVGFLGMLWGRHQTDSILMSGVVSDDHIDSIRAQGYSEAAQCIPVGMSMGALPLVLAGVAIAIGTMRRAGEKKE